jgi:PAS domain S-box-containing protein
MRKTNSNIEKEMKNNQEPHLNIDHLKSLVNIMQHQSETTQAFLDHALNEAIRITESKIGYIYHYHEDRKEFVLNTWSNEVMKECAVTNPQTCYELDKTGIWGEAVRQRKPIIINDFVKKHPLKKGYPEGHVQLLKFLTVPVFSGENIVGVVGVANKEEDYTELDVLQLQLLMDAVWKVVDLRKTLEREDHLKKVLMGIRNVNQLITQENNPDRLIERACNELTATMGYRTAWIALMDADKKIVKIVSSNLKNSKDSLEKYLREGNLPVCINKALTQEGVVSMNNAAETCSGCPVYNEYEIETGMSTRIAYGDRLFGVIAVSVPAEYAALSEEHDLLLEVAGDLGFALNKIQLEEQYNKTQKEVHESEQRFRTVLENLPGGVFLHDMEGKLLLVNELACRNTGYTRDELTGMTVSDIDSQSTTRDDRAQLWKKLKPGRSVVIESNHTRKDGSFYPAEIHINAIHLNDDPALLAVAYDISERKKAEEAIRNSDRVFNHAMDMLCIAGYDGYFKVLNPSWTRTLGWSTEELLAKPWIEFVHPGDRNATSHVRSHIIDGKEVHQFENRYICKDGSVKWLSWNSYPYPVENIMFGVARDITEKKATEQAIRESEEFVRAVIDNLPVGVAVNSVGPEVNFSYMNDNFSRIYRTTREALMKPDGFWEAVYEDPEFRERIRRKVLGDCENGNPECMLWEDIPITRKGEETSYINARNTPIPGKPLMISTVWDVTAQKKAEDGLKESEEKYRLLIEQMHEGLLVVDNDDVIKYVNPMFCRMLGYSESELNGRVGNQILVRSTDREKIIKRNHEREKGVSEQYELIFLNKSGEESTVLMNASPVKDESGVVIGSMSTCIDITERKKSESELRNREAVLSKIFEILPIGLWFADENGKLIRGNPAGVKIWGAESRVGQDEYGVFNARRLPSMEKIEPKDWALAKTIREGITVVDELLEIDGFDGKKKVILNYTAPILDDEGKIGGAIVLNRDITERYKSDLIHHIQYTIARSMVTAGSLNELYEITRRELNTLFDTSNFLVAFYNEQTGMLSSPFDMTDEETIPEWSADKSLTGAVIGQAKPLLLSKAQISEMAERGEIRLHGQRAEIWMGVPLRISDVVNGAIVVQSFTDPNAYDQSSLQVLEIIANQLSVYIEHNRAEEALRNSEETFRLIAENTADNITVMDLNMKNTYTSPSNLRGFTQDEVMNQTIEEIFTPSSLELIKETYTKQMALERSGQADPGRSIKLELEEFCKDGSTIWVEISMSFIRDNNKNAMGIVAVSRDISLRKATEAALVEAKEKAEASDRLKTAFMNNISHEIRTPLNGILGFGQMMASANLSESERQEYLEILQKSTDRLIHTITDYMDISLIASRTLQLNESRFDLNDVLYELEARTTLKASRKNLEVQLNIPALDNGIVLNTDKELFRKALDHLLDNAVKFTNQGKISFGYKNADGQLEFFVSDTGIGIEEQAMQRIFDAFGQQETGITRNYDGSGLGLSIAKGIIHRFGGRIWVESEKRKGSTFYFNIPCEQSETDATEDTGTVDKPKAIPESPVVLVAEDEESNFLYMEVVLQKSGFLVLHAENGAEAVEICRQHPEINLVLMDIKMHVMDGLEATRLIKEFRKNLPVIAITAYALSGDEHRILDAGCDDYMAKPVRREMLTNMINKHLR